MLTRSALSLLILGELISFGARAHDSLIGGAVVNPTRLAAERDNAKLNFLASQARRNAVDPKMVEAARSVYQSEYRWSKTALRVCFWNGTDKQQREVMQLADVWHQAVPVMTFDYLDAGKVRVCSMNDLKRLDDAAHAPNIRITLTANDPRPLYNPQDIVAKRGDWSYSGKAVAQNPAYPTTMNLVGAMKLREDVQLTDYYFNVRHEFGHAMSLVHEHQREVCKGWFNVKAIAESQGWTEAEASAQVDAIDESSNAYSFVGGYDIDSIMQYNFAPAWYMPDKPGQKNPCRRKNEVDNLSELDKVVVAAIYDPSLNDTPERRDLINKANQFAFAPAAAPIEESKSAQARSVEAALASFRPAPLGTSRVSIQVYQHESDKAMVLRAISNLGYPLKDGAGQLIRSVSPNVNPTLRGDPTNTILFTPDLSDQDVRYVAAALIRAGVELKSIQPYYPTKQNGFIKRNNLMQIGADITNRTRQPLSMEDVLNKPLPMFGRAVAN